VQGGFRSRAGAVHRDISAGLRQRWPPPSLATSR
jgi:hypothetical protein